MRKLFLFCLGVVLTFNGWAQTTATGFVFEDLNGNGKKDRREQGVANVAVSNGQEVVATDADGRYQLPLGSDNPVFVVKPSGYQLPVTENNLPRFYYLHKPAGSPDLKYPGVAPTGNIPKSLDFALTRANENENFTALIFGDPQVRSEQEVDYLKRGIISEVEGIKGIAFGMSLGDLVGNKLELFDPYAQAMKAIGVPWFNVMGNHDMNFDVEADSLSDETYEAHFGPANYAFNYGKVHFIVLDDILYPDPRDGDGYWAGFRKDQLTFIENDLKRVPKDFLVVLSFHIPLWVIREEDRRRLFEMLSAFPNTLSLSAHTHKQSQAIFTRKEGWLQDKPHHHYNAGTTSGSWYLGRLDDQGIPTAPMADGTPKGYAFIKFSGTKYDISYKVAGRSSDTQLNIFAPKVVPHNQKTRANIYVNFFMGTEGDEVTYRVDDGKWAKMEYVVERDPSYLHLVHEWDFAEKLLPGNRPPSGADCPHLWRGPIPTKLKPGEHRIEVKATDMFGKTFAGTKTYRIDIPE